MKWLLAAGLGVGAWLLLRDQAGAEEVPAGFDLVAVQTAAAQRWPNFKPDDFYLDVYGNDAELWAGDEIVTSQLLERQPFTQLLAALGL